MSKRKKKKNCMCENCENAVYLGEGGFVCYENDLPIVVIEDFAPTEDYLACGGKHFED